MQGIRQQIEGLDAIAQNMYEVQFKELQIFII